MTPSALLTAAADSEVDSWDLSFDDPETAESSRAGAGSESAPEALLSALNPRDRFHDRTTADEFYVLADELEEAASAASSTRSVMVHPVYAEILELGKPALPLLIERLDDTRNRPIWLRLLGSLTTFHPGAGRETIPEAVAAWRRWAKSEGYVR